MTDGFDFNAERLSEHAGELDDPRSSVDQVADAGEQVTPFGWDNAYGLLCQQFTLVTRQLAWIQLAGIRTISAVLRNTSEDLSTAADRYRQADEAAARQLTKLLSDLGEIGQEPALPADVPTPPKEVNW